MKQTKITWRSIAESFFELPKNCQSEQRMAEMFQAEHAKRTENLRLEIIRLETEMRALVKDDYLSQALNDPENQPSQWGTFPASMYAERVAEARAAYVLLQEGVAINRRASMRAPWIVPWLEKTEKFLTENKSAPVA